MSFDPSVIAGVYARSTGTPAAVEPHPHHEAPFDDSRKALVFALNAHQVTPPQPYMNKAMASIAAAKPRAKSKAIERLRELEAQAAVDNAKGRRLRAGPYPAKGLDKAHLAGYILSEFAKLDRIHQVVLSARCITCALPCDCNAPCCSGWRPVDRWVCAVDELCELTKQQAIALANEGAIPGAPMKVGLSTQPALRRFIIAQWGARSWSSVADIARRFQLNALTVSRHRGWIEEWLDTQENNAWLQLDAIFDRTGITGPFL